MKPQESFSINTEFNHLSQLIKTFWVNSELVEAQIKQAFNMGLERGSFWFDDMFSYDFHEMMKNDGGSLTLLRESSLDGKNDHYDALHKFSYWLDCELSNVYRHHINKFKWITERQQITLSLIGLIKDDTDLETVKPVSMPTSEQRKIIDSYQGYKAEGVRSYSTAEYLSPKFVNEQEEYGEDFISQLLAQAYFHGIKCSEKKNKVDLSNLLIQLYTDESFLPFNPDNGSEILSFVSGNKMVEYMLKVSKVDFSSSRELNESLEAEKADKDFLASLSEEERQNELESRKKQAEAYSNSIIDSIFSDEEDGTLEREEKKKSELYDLSERELNNKHPLETIL